MEQNQNPELEKLQLLSNVESIINGARLKLIEVDETFDVEPLGVLLQIINDNKSDWAYGSHQDYKLKFNALLNSLKCYLAKLIARKDLYPSFISSYQNIVIAYDYVKSM